MGRVRNLIGRSDRGCRGRLGDVGCLKKHLGGFIIYVHTTVNVSTNCDGSFAAGCDVSTNCCGVATGCH